MIPLDLYAWAGFLLIVLPVAIATR